MRGRDSATGHISVSPGFAPNEDVYVNKNMLRRRRYEFLVTQEKCRDCIVRHRPIDVHAALDDLRRRAGLISDGT